MNASRLFPITVCVLLLGIFFLAFSNKVSRAEASEPEQEYQISRETGLYKNLPITEGGGINLIGLIDPDAPSTDRSNLYQIDTVEIRLNKNKMNSLFYSEETFRLPNPINIVHAHTIDHLLDLSVVGPDPRTEGTPHFSYQDTIPQTDQDTQEDFFKQILLVFASKTAFFLPQQGSAILRYRLPLQKTYIDYSKGYKEKKLKIVNMIVEVPVNVTR